DWSSDVCSSDLPSVLKKIVFLPSLVPHFEKHPTLHRLFQIEDAPLIQIHFCLYNFQAISQVPEKSESLYQNVFRLAHFYCLYKSGPLFVSLELGNQHHSAQHLTFSSRY